MSPKNIPEFTLDSPVFSRTPKDELPTRRGRMGVFKNLSFYPEIVRAFAQLKKDEIGPFEDAVTINLTKAPSKDKAFLKQKDPALALYIHLRGLAKQMDIQKKIEIRRIGQQIHIIGA